MHINEQAILSAISPRDKDSISFLVNKIKDNDDPIGSSIAALKAIVNFLEQCQDEKIKNILQTLLNGTNKCSIIATYKPRGE